MRCSAEQTIRRCVVRLRARSAPGLAVLLAVALAVSCQGLQAAGGQTAVPATSTQRAKVEQARRAFQAGSEAFARGELAEARRQFSLAVQLLPKVAAGHSALATVELAQGDAVAAAGECKAALALDPTSRETQFNLAGAYATIGNGSAATTAYRAARQLRSTGQPAEWPSPSLTVPIASALVSQGAVAEARLLVEHEAAALPQDAPLQDALGTIDVRERRIEEAANHFAEAIRLDPRLASAHAHRGSVYLLQQNPDAAVQALETAVALDRSNQSFSLQLGSALIAAGRAAEAVHLLQTVLETEERTDKKAPLLSEVRYQLGLALQANGDAATALPLLQRTADLRPGDPDVLTNLGLARMQTGDAKGAVNLYQRALQAGPATVTLRENLGVALLQQSRLTEAIEQFRAGLALDGNNPQVHYDLGLALKLKDDLAGAVPEFTEAARLDPQLPDPPFTLGIILMQQGQFAEAGKQFQRAVELRPQNGAAWEMLGDVQKELAASAEDAAQAQLREEAMVSLRHAIELEPEQPSPHVTLAAILVQRGDLSTAAAERKRAAELSRVAVNRQKGEFALKSGRALLASGKVTDALTQMQAAVAADPDNREAHLGLAQVFTQQGRPVEAARERALAGGLTSPGPTRKPSP